MNRIANRLPCLCAALLLGACAAPPLQTAPGAEISEEGLQRMSGTEFDEVWARPGLRLGATRGVMLDSTTVAFRDVDERVRLEATRVRATPDAFPIPADQRASIEASFRNRLAEALEQSPQFRRSAVPGAGTLALRAELVDFVSKMPAEGTLGLNQAFVTSAGEATLIIELWDAERGELLARAIDHRRAGPPGPELVRGNRVTSWVEIDRQMRRWGRDVRMLVDQLYALDGA
jgi:hypothetical protein